MSAAKPCSTRPRRIRAAILTSSSTTKTRMLKTMAGEIKVR
jgi:hypothetical protein